MRIAIDGYELNKKFTGVGRYIYNLFGTLSKIDKKNKYTIFLKENSKKANDLKNIKKQLIDSDRGYTYWQNLILRKHIKKGNFDLFFATNYCLPFFYKGKSVLTVHDISWKTLPDNYSYRERIIKHIKSLYSLKKTDLIFTVSEFSKQELIKYYKIKPEKIISIHSGLEDSIKESSKKSIKSFKKKYNIENAKTIGFLGSLFKRRHIKELVKAFKIASKQTKNLKLFIVGKNYYEKKFEENLMDKNIIWKKRIPESEINAFYSSLDLFTFLSDYEGFGFPPLEALNCSTVPLLLSSSSLKEIYKDIAVFIETPKVKIITNKLLYFFKNQKNIESNIFGIFSKKRRYFSWERTAKEYLKYINNFTL